MKTSTIGLMYCLNKEVVKISRLYFQFLKLIFLSGICVFLLLNCNSVSAQAPDTLWTKTYGGSSSEDGYSVQQTTDGGFIITGFTYSYGVRYGDVWLIRTDADGDTLWTKTYGTLGVDQGRSVQQTGDGGFIITGYAWMQSKGLQVWLIRTNSSGNALWSKDFGGINDEIGYCVQQTDDGGFIIVGEVIIQGNMIDAWLIKTDGEGNEVWSQIYGGTNFDKGYSVQQTTDGGYIVTGYTSSFGFGYADVWLIKTNASGDTLWTKTYGGFDNDFGYSVQQTTDGGYLITGSTDSFRFGSGVFVIKTDATGNTLWANDYEGGRGYSGRQTSDGGYIITGWSEPYGPPNSNVYLLRTNSSGDILWTKAIGGDGYEEGRSVQQTSDGGYIVCGFTDSYGAGGYDIWLIKVAGETTGIDGDKKSDILIYPNPASGKFKITGSFSQNDVNQVEIIDVFGKVVKSFNGNFNDEATEFDLSNLPSGIYLVRISSSNSSFIQKVIKF